MGIDARRPSNRRELILSAAAEAFAERGYHNVALDEVAMTLGISGPALYRHFPSKYALFVETADQLALHLTSAWPDEPLGVDLSEPAAAAAQVEAVLDALVVATMRARRSGGIYRWEGRYLAPEDRAAVGRRYEAIVQRMARLVTTLRPDLEPAQVDLLSAAALSVVASVTGHRTTLSVARARACLVPAATAVIHLSEPTAPALPPAPTPLPPSDAPAARAPRRTQIVEAATRLFHQRGYAEVTMEEIAREVGLTTSGLYRHVRGKSDLLMTTLQSAADHLAEAVEAAQIRGVSAEVGLDRLARAYVDHCFAHREQMSVYSSAALTLAPSEQSRLRELQRTHVELWRTLLCAHDPRLDPREARTLTYAAINIVTDIGRRRRWRTDDGSPEVVTRIIRAVVGADVAPPQVDR